MFAGIVWLGAPAAAEVDDAVGFIEPAALDMRIAPITNDEIFISPAEFGLPAIGEIDPLCDIEVVGEVEPCNAVQWIGEIEEIDRSHLARPAPIDEMALYEPIDLTGITAIGWDGVTAPRILYEEDAPTRSGWAAAGAITLLFGGLGATLMVVVVYKKP